MRNPIVFMFCVGTLCLILSLVGLNISCSDDEGVPLRDAAEYAPTYNVNVTHKLDEAQFAMLVKLLAGQRVAMVDPTPVVVPPEPKVVSPVFPKEPVPVDPPLVPPKLIDPPNNKPKPTPADPETRPEEPKPEPPKTPETQPEPQPEPKPEPQDEPKLTDPVDGPNIMDEEE